MHYELCITPPPNQLKPGANTMYWITLSIKILRVLAIAIAVIAAFATLRALRKYTRRVTQKDKNLFNAKTAIAKKAAADARAAAEAEPDCAEAITAARITWTAANNAAQANATIQIGQTYSLAESTINVLNKQTAVATKALKMTEKAIQGDIDRFNWFIILVKKQDALQETIRYELLREVQEEIKTGATEIKEFSGDDARVIKHIDRILDEKLVIRGSKEKREQDENLLKIAKSSEDYMERIQELTRVMATRYEDRENATQTEYKKIQNYDPNSKELKWLSLKKIIYHVLGTTMDSLYSDWNEESEEKAMVFLETYGRKSLSPELFE